MADFLSRFVKRRSPYNAPAPIEEVLPGLLCPSDAQAALLPRHMFDAPQYLIANPDVAASGLDPYDHYVRYGYEEERRGRRHRSVPSESRALSTRARPQGNLIDRIVDLEADKRTLFEAWDRHLHRVTDVGFDDLAETVDDAIAPPLDRIDCDEAGLDPDQKFWRDNGYVIKRGFIPDEMLDRYTEIRRRHPSVNGWSCPVPYMHVAEVRDLSLYPPMMDLMERLVGEEMGLALNLTGWVSTDRNWHQDDFLNPFFINSWYAAAWIALDDIHPDSGPFEFVPGSHKWPVMRSQKVRLYLQPGERDTPHWPKLAERVINTVAEAKIAESGLPIERFHAKKGDVLIWHGRLMHRGTVANVPGMKRPSLIAHYSGLSHRVDMSPLRDANGKIYFNLPLPLDFDPYSEDLSQAAE
jgi:hypothetical protein